MDGHFKGPDGDLPERLSEESWFVREIFIVKNSSFVLYDLSTTSAQRKPQIVTQAT